MSVTPRPRLVDGDLRQSLDRDQLQYRHERALATRSASELSLVRVPGLDPARLVVMKRLQASLQTDPIAVDRFRHEARVAGFLDHPRIVRVLEVVASPREHFYTMEYVPGLDLACLVEVLAAQQRRLPVECALQIAIEACVALDYVHALSDDRGTTRGLVHGRLSPSKILIAETGAIKLTGFGGPPLDPVREPAARGSRHDNVHTRRPGELADARGDVLALGLLLYELTAGRPELEPVLRRALAHDRALRYQSAGELQADLETVLWSKWPTASPRSLADLVAIARAELGPRMRRLAHGSTGLDANAVAALERADRPTPRGSAPPLTSHPTGRVPILPPLPAPPALPAPPSAAADNLDLARPATDDPYIGRSAPTSARAAAADLAPRAASPTPTPPSWPVRRWTRVKQVAVAAVVTTGLALSAWAIWHNVHEPSSLPEILSAHPAPPADLVVHGPPAGPPPAVAPHRRRGAPVVPPPEVTTAKPRWTPGKLDATATIAHLEVTGAATRPTRHAIERALGALRACYRAGAHAQQVAPTVELRLVFEIARSLRPVKIQASDGGALDTLASCAAKVVAQLHDLPTPRRGAHVTADIEFRPLP